MEVTQNNIIKKERQSNFELLRIVCILIIICGHLCNRTEAFNILYGLNNFFARVIHDLYRISVQLFVILGSWFMIDNKFKPEKILILYGQYWFYMASAFIITYIVCKHFEWTFLFPFSNYLLWFIPTYLSLLAMIPFLKKVIIINKELFRILIILLTIIIPFTSNFIFFNNRMDNFLYFMYLFLLVAYFKKYIYPNLKIKPTTGLLLGIFIYLCLLLFKLEQYTEDFKSFPNIIISFCVFYYFTHLKIKYNKFINFLAKSVLATYIIHEIPRFHNYLFINIFKAYSWLGSKYTIFYMIGMAFIIFMACSVIDFFRRQFVEPLWVKSFLYKFLKGKLEKFYAGI